MPRSDLTVVSKFTVKQKTSKISSQFKYGPESHFLLISLLYNSN